jgi:DnaK suppressor protein
MTDIEKKKCRKVLEAKRQEIEQGLRKREAITIERTADALDEVRQAAEAELRMRTLDQESALLRMINGALSRLDDGSFGSCLQCGAEISPRRLAALPWAPLCIDCQTAVEHDSATSEEWEMATLNAA